MKNLFSRKEIFSIRKFSMGVASVMIASSLIVSSQANVQLLKAKENIEVQANKDINIRVIERDGGAVVELTATKDLTDIDVNVMLNGNRVASYHIENIKAGQKIDKKVTKEQLEKIKKLISNGQKTLPNTAIVERSATQTINIAGNNLRVDVKYHVEDNSVPEVKSEKSEVKPIPEVKPEKPEAKPTPEIKPEKPEVKPTPEVKPGQPEVKPIPEVKPEKPEAKPKPEKKPTPGVKPGQPEEKPTPEVKPGQPEVKPEKPEVTPTPEVKPEKPSDNVNTTKPLVEENNKKDEEVIIKDKNLRKLINKNIDTSRADDEKITRKEIESLKEISMRDMKDNPILKAKSLKDTPEFKFIQSYGITNLSGLENAVNLEKLDLGENEISDLSPIAKLNKLLKLSLIRNRISDLTPISELTNLEYLDLYANKIEDISPLAKLTNLRHLDLHNNNNQTGDPVHPTVSGGINDISAVRNMSKLELLSLGSNNITDITPIKNLTNVKDLVLSGNHISNYEGMEQYISNILAKQMSGEGSISFAGQRLNYDKTVDVSKTNVSIDSPFRGINELGEKIAKVFESNEPVNLFSTVTTNVEGVSATYNRETSKFDFTFTEEFLNKNQGKVVPIDLKLSVDDYIWNIRNIKLNIKEKVAESKKLVIDDLVVTNENKPVTDKLTYILVNKKNDNEVLEKNTNKGMLSGLELTKDEVYTLSLNDNEKYQMEDIDVVAKEEDGFSVLYNVKTNEIIQNLEVKKIEKEETSEDDVVTLDGITAKVTNSSGAPISNVPFRLFEYDGIIPNIVKQEKTGEDGILTFTANKLKPNKKYELRIEKRDSAFNRENVIFTTDEDGEVVGIDNKAVTEQTTGVIDFKEERKNDKEIKTIKSYYKVVDEKGNPVENVELSVNGIRTKITTLKNARSNKNGIVELDLETKVNGVDYIVNVSKNDQFNWEFRPDSVNLNVSEEGKISYNDLNKDYTLEDYNGTKIPVFVVKKIDLNYLKTDLKEKIKEAEAELEKSPNKELKDIVNSAKEELTKSETLPIYVKGYIGNLTTALEKIKKSKEDEKPLKKVAIPEMLVRNGKTPELNEVTVEFINKNNPKDKVVATSENGMLSNVQLTVGEEYIIKIKGRGDEVFPNNLVLKEEEGEFIPYKVGTDEFYDSIDLGELRKEEKPKEDLSKIRGELEKLVSRELRTEKGYIANEGNQPANNAWIFAKTEAEKVLRNPNATKEQLENEIENLTTKTNEAIVGSEKTKVTKLIVASDKANEDKLKLRAELNVAKTIEEVKVIAEKVGGKVTPSIENKPGEKPETPEISNPNKPGNETTIEKPKNDTPVTPPVATAKPVIDSYEFDNKIVENTGGIVTVTLKGKNLTDKNVKIKVLNPFTAEKNEEISNSITYKKVEEDVVATIRVPANTTSNAKSYNLVFTNDLGMKVTTNYIEERGENGRVITVLPTGKTKQDAVLSFVTISSYQAHRNTDLTTTTTDKGNVSKKTVAHLYGTNLKAEVTKVKIIDQNGVEWPIHTTGSNIETSIYPMMVIGKLGNGISGNGTYQEAEIVLPNVLDRDMTFTYVFAPDGVNFDEKHKVTAVVEKTSNVKSVVKRTITVKYQDENGKTLKDSKILTGYSWFDYNIEKVSIDGYKNVIVKGNTTLSGKFGDVDKEIVLVYTNKEVTQPSSPETTTRREESLDSLKAKLKELADKDLKQEDSYNKVSLELQSNWKKARALAKKFLAESENKEEISNQIKALEKAIAAIKTPTEVTKPKPELSSEEGNTITPSTKNIEELKSKLQDLVNQDPTIADDYKLKGSLQEKAWKKARAHAQALLHSDSTSELLEEQIGKLKKALETLKDENSQGNNISSEVTTPNNPSSTGSEELEKVRTEAKSKVLNSEFIQDKAKYIKRINEATTVEVLRVLISEVEKLNSNEGRESTIEENISETTEKLKEKLQILVDNELMKTDKYTLASPELKTEYKKARALARKLLNEDTSKEVLKEQIKVLETVIKKITA